MNYQPAFTFPWLEEILACPACSASVRRFEDLYTCSACKRTYPVRYGIPDFRVAPDPYISIGQELDKIDKFFAPGRSFEDMLKAYYDITPESPPQLHTHYITAMNHAAVRGAALVRKLQKRFPDSGRKRFLDLGCGTAGMSIAACRDYREVVGVDVALRWLVMASVRLDEQGVAIPLICANAEALPLKDSSFNAVAADGVLEHVRSSARMRDETLRVLDSTGGFFFTTTNRYSILPEPHVRILGFGLLPRRLMEKVAMKFRHTPYRTHLHSRNELLRLFDGNAEVLPPQYDRGDLGRRHERVRRIWEFLRKIPFIRAILTRVVPQFFIFGQHGERGSRRIAAPAR
ncbi:MAG TPA: methyltransferase domain-containing protein [Gemmatimonadaceae bacterium]|nr:methyltransferase domain-containing protein [Gemmatimonadaceae bacterium]